MAATVLKERMRHSVHCTLNCLQNLKEPTSDWNVKGPKSEQKFQFIYTKYRLIKSSTNPMQHSTSEGTYSRSATKEIHKTVYFRSKDRLSKACVLRHGMQFSRLCQFLYTQTIYSDNSGCNFSEISFPLLGFIRACYFEFAILQVCNRRQCMRLLTPGYTPVNVFVSCSVCRFGLFFLGALFRDLCYCVIITSSFVLAQW